MILIRDEEYNSGRECVIPYGVYKAVNLSINYDNPYDSYRAHLSGNNINTYQAELEIELKTSQGLNGNFKIIDTKVNNGQWDEDRYFGYVEVHDIQAIRQVSPYEESNRFIIHGYYKELSSQYFYDIHTKYLEGRIAEFTNGLVPPRQLLYNYIRQLPLKFLSGRTEHRIWQSNGSLIVCSNINGGIREEDLRIDVSDQLLNLSHNFHIVDDHYLYNKFWQELGFSDQYARNNRINWGNYIDWETARVTVAIDRAHQFEQEYLGTFTNYDPSEANFNVERLNEVCDRVRGITESREQRNFAEERAQKTLKRIIGRYKWANFVKLGYVKQPSKINEGLSYRLFSGDRMTEVFKGRKKLHKLCVVITDKALPPTDSLITRLLMIQSNETEFLDKAIKYGVKGENNNYTFVSFTREWASPYGIIGSIS